MDGVNLSDVLVANQTTYVDIYLKRTVDVNVFQLDRGDIKRGSITGEEAERGRVFEMRLMKREKATTSPSPDNFACKIIPCKGLGLTRSTR